MRLAIAAALLMIAGQAWGQSLPLYDSEAYCREIMALSEDVAETCSADETITQKRLAATYSAESKQ